MDYFFPPHPQEVIGKQWSKTQSPELKRILALARDALLFIPATGKQHQFEEFRQRRASGSLPLASEQPSPDFAILKERLNQTEAFFTQLRDDPSSATERELIQEILNTLRFISATGQHSAFAEYLEHVEAGGLPYVIAAFHTREEAEASLRQYPQPPDSASVLIADTYYWVLHDRYKGTLHLRHSRILERHLAAFRREHPPRATAAFASQEEAVAWLHSQPNPSLWNWVLIAGEPYLAAYFPNIRHRALYPLSMANGYEEQPEEPLTP